MNGFLFQAFVYLFAAVVSVLVAKRMGLGSVLGYLIAGIAIGPVLQLVGNETEDLQSFAEFGVVMMLFLVGLELQPRALWDMKAKLLGLGGLQIVGTGLALMLVGMALGQPWSVSLVGGFVLSMSSTAIVLQTLAEKGLLKSDGGRSSFSVLLFQDIAVIPMLALIPLLARPEYAGTDADAVHAADSAAGWMEGLPGWQVTIITLAAVASVVVIGNYLCRPFFRIIASAKLREVFTAAALLLVIAIALLMTLVGLSPALGTFLAGVVLANSEFRHELESDIEPFKGLLLGLFFITVGASVNFGLLWANFAVVVGLTIGVMSVKAAALFALGHLFKLKGADKWLFALGLAQAGEFGFVLLAFTVQSAVLPRSAASILLLVITLSMMLTPALFIFLDKVVTPIFNRRQAEDDDTEEISEPAHIIVAGLGRFGQVINRILLANGHKTVVLDYRADIVDGLRKFGVKSFFGDASRPDLLHSAGLREAKVLIVAIDDMDRALEIVKHARRENETIHIVARARDRFDVYKLFQAGANDIVREVFDSSVRAAGYALTALGMHPYDAEKSKNVFVKHDRAGLRRLAPLWKPEIAVYDNPEYVAAVKEITGAIEKEMTGERGALIAQLDRGWTPPSEPAESVTPATKPIILAEFEGNAQ